MLLPLIESEPLYCSVSLNLILLFDIQKTFLRLFPSEKKIMQCNLLNQKRLDFIIKKEKPEIIIQTLIDKKLITLSDKGTFILSRDLTKLSFEQLHELLPWRLPKPEVIEHTSNNSAYLKLIKASEVATSQDFSISLAKLY